MDPAVVAALRGVVDAGAGDADGAANAFRTHRQMRAAHADGQTRPGLGEIDREARKNSQAAVEAKISHRASRQIIRVAAAKDDSGRWLLRPSGGSERNRAKARRTRAPSG